MEQFIITEKCGTMRMLGREALKGKWKLAIGAVLIYELISFLPTVIIMGLAPGLSFLTSIYGVLIAGPFALGLSIFFLNITRNEKVEIAQIFYGFEKFGKSLGLYLVIFIFVFLWSLLIIPGALVGAFVPFLLPFTVLLLTPMVIALIRYSQAFFILADRSETSALEGVSNSKVMMSGNKLKYFLLILSFIGWGLLACVPISAWSFTILSKINFSVILTNSAHFNQMVMEQMYSPSSLLIMFVASSGVFVLMVYVYATTAIFYDMVSGNLRPGYISSTAETISAEPVEITLPEGEEVMINEPADEITGEEEVNGEGSNEG